MGVSAERKREMLAYYNKHKDSFNKNRILNDIKQGKSSGIHRKTLTAHDWGKQALGILKPKVTEKTITDNRAHQTFQNTTLSQTQLVASIFKDPDIVASTKAGWKTTANSMRTAFGFSIENFSHMFRKTDEEILTKLIEIHPVPYTRLKKIKLILRLYDMDPDFKVMLGPTRYHFWEVKAKFVDSEQQVAKRTKRETVQRAFHEEFSTMFLQLERKWRNTEPASDRHIMSLIYTLGA
jgi:hypothetical protein